jgi:hypothetical protein
VGRAPILLVCAGVAAWLASRSASDQWYHDAMTRTYAGDHFIPGASRRPEYSAAAQTAARWYLPVGWTIDLQNAGVPPSQLDAAAGRVQRRFVSLGPPRGTTEGEAAQRKAIALRAGVSHG